jgi:hypothetical protein
MEECAPARNPEPIPLHPVSVVREVGEPRSDAVALLRPLVAVLAEIAERVERERVAQGTDAA